MHAFVERELVARVGDAGRRLHTGRSRNEQVAVDLRLYLKRRVPEMQQAHRRRSIAGLAERAADAGDAMMPSYTHLRRAQPILAAHFFLAHAAALRRDHARFGAVLVEIDELPLGSGAIAGTSYPIDMPLARVTLGFARVVANSIDATGDRDFVSSFLHACALAMVHVSRIAEDLILFTSEEFGFFDLADTAATGSSLMPQKKNPDPLELVRGKAAACIGRPDRLAGVDEGAADRLQQGSAGGQGSALRGRRHRRSHRCAACRLGAARHLRSIASVTARAASGLLLATDVADYLVAQRRAFPRRSRDRRRAGQAPRRRSAAGSSR